MEQLVSMGFDRERSSNALQLCDGDLERTCDMLAEWSEAEARAEAAAPAAPKPAPSPAPMTPRSPGGGEGLSRLQRLENDVEAMAALVSDPSSRYHALLAPSWSWQAPQLQLRTAAGEPCTLTFDAEEYPQGASEWTDHPAFPAFPAFSQAAHTSRVQQLVDLIAIQGAAPPALSRKPSGGGARAGSDEDNEDEDGSGSSIASDDELFGGGSSGDNSEFSDASDSDDDYANFGAGDTSAGDPSPRPGSARNLHADLRRDIEIVRRVFGPGSVKISEANFEEKVVVELTLQLTDVLDRNTMIAWSLPPRDPHVTIRVTLDRHLYTETRSVPEEGRPDNPYFHVYNKEYLEGIPLLDKEGKPSYDLGKKGIPVCVQLCHAVLGPQSGFVKRWWEAFVASKSSGTAGGGGGGAHKEAVDPVTGWPVLQTARYCLTGQPYRKTEDAAIATVASAVVATAGGSAADPSAQEEEVVSLARAISASLSEQGLGPGGQLSMEES